MEFGSEASSERTVQARIGISALNLIVPGLGLARLGEWRRATLFFLAPFAALGLSTFGMGHFPITSYRRAVLALVVLLGLFVALYLTPIVLTWCGSKFRTPAVGWSRWYGLALIAIVMLSASNFAVPLMHHFYKPFFAPSESMAPTIDKGDKFIADMQWRGPFKRGEIIIFSSAGGVRDYRIVGLPGDKVAMRGGRPILNGEVVSQTAVGRTSFEAFDGAHAAAVFTERLPGEVSEHRVLDTGSTQFDETQELVVPAGHLFVLGDNRDSAADSRVPPALGGVGMIPFEAVLGRPMYIHWSRNHTKVGARLDS